MTPPESSQGRARKASSLVSGAANHESEASNGERPTAGDMAAYRDWIRHTVPACSQGMCAAMTDMMVEEFPELRRVRGHYVGNGKQYPHWWCETESGDVVDPTVSQFGFVGEYVEHVGPDPTGKCLNCGAYCFNGDGVCSRACGDEFVGRLSPEAREAGASGFVSTANDGENLT